MKHKELLWALQQCQSIQEPKRHLEQYSTSPQMATEMMMAIAADIEDKVVLDLGCGGAILACAASLCGAIRCLAVDLDGDMIKLAQENIEELELDDEIDIMQCDASSLPGELSRYVDVVIMNPPFGTKNNEGADMVFVKAALKLGDVVYSLHKTSTRKFILKQASALDCEVEVIAQLRWNLPKTYKFHKKKSVDIEVDFVRFRKKI